MFSGLMTPQLRRAMRSCFLKSGLIQALDGVVLRHGLIVKQARDGRPFRRCSSTISFHVFLLDHAVKLPSG